MDRSLGPIAFLRLAVALAALALAVVLAARLRLTPQPAPADALNDVRVARGAELARQYCATCHGPTFQGELGIGPSWYRNAFIRSKTVEELIEFLKVGRPEKGMPPKGGQPSLTDEDLRDLATFLKSLQREP